MCLRNCSIMQVLSRCNRMSKWDSFCTIWYNIYQLSNCMWSAHYAIFTNKINSTLEPSRLPVDHNIRERVRKEGGSLKIYPLKKAAVVLWVPTTPFTTPKISESFEGIPHLGKYGSVLGSCLRKQKWPVAAGLMPRVCWDNGYMSCTWYRKGPSWSHFKSCPRYLLTEWVLSNSDVYVE